MTPGAYLRQCREAAGLSIQDVALRTETKPAVSARSREDIIRALEEDVARLTVIDAAALQPIYGFDWQEMARTDAPAAQVERHGIALRRVA